MDVESAQVHIGDEKLVEQSNPGTPVNAQSVLSASTPEVWATPAAVSANKLSSMREIVSMPSLNVDVETKQANGEATSPTNGMDNLVSTPNGLDRSDSHDKSQNATLDISEALSPLSDIMVVPPNTPQITSTVPSPESGSTDWVSDNNITVYEKTPGQDEFKPGHTRTLSGVPVNTEKLPAPEIVITGATPEKSTSKTYIVPETVVDASEAVRVVVEGTEVPVSNGSVDGDGEVPLPANTESVNISMIDRSVNRSNIASDSEAALVSQVHDCEDLLGGFLVRPCPSMRGYRRHFAKAFVVFLMVFIVAIIVVSILLNRMQ